MSYLDIDSITSTVTNSVLKDANKAISDANTVASNLNASVESSNE